MSACLQCRLRRTGPGPRRPVGRGQTEPRQKLLDDLYAWLYRSGRSSEPGCIQPDD